MASVTASDRTHSGTLVAATQDVITFPANYRGVTISNRHATAEIWARTDHTDVTVGGDGAFLVPPNQSLVLTHQSRPDEPALGISNPLVVKLISSGTPTYTVEA